MTKDQLDVWVKSLGDAWVALDVDVALSLVDKEDISWQESPFEDPITDWSEIYKVWQQDLAKQKDVTFEYEILACDDGKGVARWKASYVKVSDGEMVVLDGIFLVELNNEGLCSKFIMWALVK